MFGRFVNRLMQEDHTLLLERQGEPPWWNDIHFFMFKYVLFYDYYYRSSRCCKASSTKVYEVERESPSCDLCAHRLPGVGRECRTAIFTQLCSLPGHCDTLPFPNTSGTKVEMKSRYSWLIWSQISALSGIPKSRRKVEATEGTQETLQWPQISPPPPGLDAGHYAATHHLRSTLLVSMLFDH